MGIFSLPSLLTASALALALLTPAIAEASPEGPASTELTPLTDAEVAARLSFIRTSLDEGEQGAKLWYYGWIGGFTALTAGHSAVALVTGDEKLRTDAWIGAATSALGLISTAVIPWPSALAPARVRGSPDATPEQRRLSLREAEEALRSAAELERLGRSWLPQVGGVIVNLAAFGLRWFRYDRRATALLGLAGGLVVSEAKVLTQPTTSMQALQAYEQRFPTARKEPPQVSFNFAFVPGGFAFDMTF